MASKTLVAVAVALCCVTGSSATLINLINQCPYSVTAFARSGSSATNSYNLGASGGYQQLNVGSSFPAGLIFASTTGSEDNAQVWPYVLQHLSYTLVGTIPRTEGPPVLQATQLEITAGSNGRDYYDISLVVSKACAFCCLPWNIELRGPELGPGDRLCAFSLISPVPGPGLFCMASLGFRLDAIY